MDAEVSASCAHCGESAEQPFTCSHCDKQYCSNHRLPESHDCPLFVAEAAESPTHSQVHADRTQGSGVEAPEPMDLDRSSHRADDPDASEAERAERLQARRRARVQSSICSAYAARTSYSLGPGRSCRIASTLHRSSSLSAGATAVASSTLSQ